MESDMRFQFEFPSRLFFKGIVNPDGALKFHRNTGNILSYMALTIQHRTSHKVNSSDIINLVVSYGDSWPSLKTCHDFFATSG